MISKEELYYLKEEKKILVASKEEAKQDYIAAKIQMDKATKAERREALAELRYRQEVYYWFCYQVKETTNKINKNYKEVFSTPKPKQDKK